MDTVYIAGILPALTGLSRIEVNSFFRSSMPEVLSPTMINNRKECEHGKYGIIHGVKKPIYMKQIDVLVHDMLARNVTCNVPPECTAIVKGKCVLRGDQDEEESNSGQKGSKKV